MKPIKYFAPAFSSRRLLNYAVLALILISQSSCFKQFYQTNTMHKTDAFTLEQLQNERKYFIVHTPTGPFSLNNVKVSSDSLSGEKGLLNPQYDVLLNPKAENGNALARKDKAACLKEVHLYTNRSFDSTNQLILAISQIDRVDVYGSDIKATRESRVVGIVGITLGVAAIIGLVVAISNLSFGFHL